MMFLLSPAKSLDFKTPALFDLHSNPAYIKEAEKLIGIMRKKSISQICSLMNISEKLGQLNFDRYRDWTPDSSSSKTKQALYCFTGDVYMGLNADVLDRKDIEYAQQNLRILSGLYGLLKPLDLICPYRLEMGIRLKNPAGSSLYDFWREKISGHLNKELQKNKASCLVNLASQEYAKAADLKNTPVLVISPEFRDLKNGEYKIISFFAKKARGTMAQFMIQNRVTELKNLLKFDLNGYQYDESRSEEFSPVFIRDKP